MAVLTCGTCGKQAIKLYLTEALPEESVWYCSQVCDWRHASSLRTILEWSKFYMITQAPPEKKKRQIGEPKAKQK